MDGDGKADYVVVGDHVEVTAYLNRGGDGNGGFVESEFASGPAGNGSGHRVRFADIDGDGRADYLSGGRRRLGAGLAEQRWKQRRLDRSGCLRRRRRTRGPSPPLVRRRRTPW
ncbi:FG-GAP repeat domain-containing protein [Streptomyces sp. CBMA370]|uniref:FG-GAP repeat domain-containing protein n=1 Tax=unclassified Streptomyces TaxID=2593676 RepID=UPI001661D56C|nr:hypothetical protein [Streptomyces sp. CBMA291]MBD0718020.1 hypothetical protein [Streptomyces sp. CBMA370]